MSRHQGYKHPNAWLGVDLDVTMPRSNRNAFSIGVVCVFVIVCMYLYRSIDTRSSTDLLKNEKTIANMKMNIDQLQNILNDNRQEIAELKKKVADAERKRKQEWDKQVEKENEVYDEKAEAQKALEKKVEQIAGDADHKAVEEEEKAVVPEPRGKVGVVHDFLHRTTTKSTSPVCQLRKDYVNSKTHVQMLDLYDVEAFDNSDGGAWKQGWEVTYDKDKVAQEKKLEVIVIPHSHCDPGWIKTFEQYYATQTKKILDGMYKSLSNDQDFSGMRFIYAEISFFELWWKDQSEAVRAKVRELLDSGKLEIVTGGWVMTDEANAHYFSIITELMEGHEFIKNHLGGFRPTSHWSIDPFGLSPSIPYLLTAANITNAAIQRVHYSVKKHLAKKKQLEFMWRQLWGAHGKQDMRTHLFPFYSYDVPHTCGPNPAVCCQFDFRRLPGNGPDCPWGKQPVRTNSANAEERAFMLYDQYRKKSQLYKTNVLLVPLGDDFRYDTPNEWNEQYVNYMGLFKEMDKHPEWNIHARFGTLADYFTELDRSLRAESESLPVLSGDFFTYADRDDHYWSGYFTSRPFYKQMDRVLQHQLRAAEIAFTLKAMKGEKAPEAVFAKLILARRALSLFQHHDGVTGTAKDFVMVDYGQKMHAALTAAEMVLSDALGSLLGGDAPASGSMLLDEYREIHDALPLRRTYSIGDFVVAFNSLSRSRTEPTCIYVNSINAALKTDGDREVKQQISPLFDLVDDHLVPSEKYELCFVDELEPFGVSVYQVIKATGSEHVVMATLTAKGVVKTSEFKFDPVTANTYVLDNSVVAAEFDTVTGFLKAVTPKDHGKIDVDLHYVHYGVRPHQRLKSGNADNLSGAYLFLPDGEAMEIPKTEQDFVVVRGPIMSRNYVVGPKDLKILQVYSLAQRSPSVEITNEVDIRSKTNFELAMRLKTSVQSGDDLFTDLNGLQLIRRKRMLDKLPLQAHFYPMPASAFIEDSNTRLSLLGNQALGVASLASGQMEVVLDRRLDQDDGRGLFQPVMDNHRTLSRFRLLVEPLTPAADVNHAEERIGFYSVVGFAQSMELHYPVLKMLTKSNPGSESVAGLPESLPCDVHIVTLRTSAGPTNYDGNGSAAAKNEAALILHRPLTDCRSKLQLQSDCIRQGNAIVPKKLFPTISSAQEASLTLLYEGKATEEVALQPQDVTSVKLSWHSCIIFRIYLDAKLGANDNGSSSPLDGVLLS
ncbi:unnamed protein product [Cylicocyclus nassatus]|uniref:Alpha-mannosidase n=1 Tax=Cylicocyclus nassatus TaxID=53992 RepID=A0AA36GR66_CYLNA|nr:unnamed protein product [Cylicocyclus nassatus]